MQINRYKQCMSKQEMVQAEKVEVTNKQRELYRDTKLLANKTFNSDKVLKDKQG